MKLKNRKWLEITLLLSAKSVSFVGNTLSVFAIPWFVFELTGSPMITAGIVVAGQLPNIFIGLFSGYLIDRLSPRFISLASDLVNAVVILIIPLLYSLDKLNILILGGLVFLSQVVDVPGETARAVLMPSIIDRHKLPRERVNGLSSLVETAADLAGPVLAGLLLGLIGSLNLLVLDSFTFILSFLIVLTGIKHYPGVRSDKRYNGRKSVRIWKNSILIRLLSYDLINNLIAVSLLSLTLPLLGKTLQGGAGWLGIWFTSFAAGTTLTTLLYTFLGHRVSQTALLKYTPFGQGTGLLAVSAVLYFGAPPILIAPGLFLYGLSLGVGSVVDATVLQKSVPEEYRGSVFSVFSSLRYAGVPLGLLFCGYFLELKMFSVLMLIFSLITVSTSLLWFLKNDNSFQVSSFQ